MSKRGILVETLERETQFTWTASGDEIVGKSTRLWCAYTGQRNDTYFREKQEFAALTHQLRAIFEALTDGVVFRDVEGKTLLMNSAARRMLELGSEMDV